MMRFSYYPGCSMAATGRAYGESMHAIIGKLGIELAELDDWNCCGATSYMSVRELLSYAISARNLSIAAKQGMDLVAPCSACFTILRKTDHYMHDYPDLRRKVNEALGAAGLSYEPGSVKVRHLLEVAVMGDNLERLRAAVSSPLVGLRVAPYYGCQTLRPRVDFDDPEDPHTLDDLLKALGADVVPYPTKSKCCGGSLMATNEKAALRLCRNILLAAHYTGAHCIATVCPLCQMNLDGFQAKVNSAYGTNFNFPILYFTQLMGVAMGVEGASLGLGREIVAAAPVLAHHGTGPKAPFAGKEV
jgi:heterodisulfide reductase subunit B